MPCTPKGTPVLKLPGPVPKAGQSGSPMILRCFAMAASMNGCRGSTCSSFALSTPDLCDRCLSHKFLAASTTPSRKGGPSHLPKASLYKSFLKSSSVVKASSSSPTLLITDISRKAGLLFPWEHKPAPSWKSFCSGPLMEYETAPFSFSTAFASSNAGSSSVTVLVLHGSSSSPLPVLAHPCCY